jgi:hypothetical protein
LLKERRVTQFSYAYDVPRGGYKRTPDGLELSKVLLYEVSTTPIGANSMTELVGAKSALRKAAGDVVLSARDAGTLRDAVSQLTDLVAAFDSESDSGGSDDTGDGPAKDEEPAPATEPAQVKSEEPTTLDAASVRLIGDVHQKTMDALT